MLSLADSVGHRRLTLLLSQAIARATLPPTLLFVGPPGVGKHRVARSVAAVLNCLSPRRDADGLPIDACQACRSCDRIARDVHVDVLTLAPDDRAIIAIDAVRDVLGRTGFRPFEGRRRVIIIDQADALGDQAQNALLKSLEEPPPGTIFLLITASPDALLPTVRSRCMRLRFGRLTAGEIEAMLIRDHAMPAADARAAAALADGSVGQALALGSTDLAALRETALLFLQQSARGGVAGRLQAATPLAVGRARKERSRDELGLVLRLVAAMLRDLELLNSGGDPGALANPVVAEELRRLAPLYAGARARDAFAVVDRALDAVSRNAGIKVVSEWVAVRV